MSLAKAIAPFLRQRQLVDDEAKAKVDAALARLAAADPVDPSAVDVLWKPTELTSFLVYGAAQNAISSFAEVAFDHPKLMRINNLVVAWGEEYMPGWPLNSPVSVSFATAFYLYDLRLARVGETMAGLFYQLDVLPGRPAVLAEAVQHLAESRCGFYEVQAVDGWLLTVEELHSGEVFDAVCASGYEAQVGELWYCRFVPSLHEDEDFEIAVTSPYVLVGHPRAAYEAFLKRQRLGRRSEDEEALLTRVFKHPRDPAYWMEFVLQAYDTHSNHHIELAGLPDRVGTKPHEDNGRKLRIG